MSINQDITNLPTPPNRSDSPSDFSDKADAFLAALPTFQTELNTYADEANTTQTAINTSETNAADAAQSALEWASKIDGIVDTTDYSAKAYALGGTGVTDVTGAAKEWAVKTGTTVDGSDYSAKDYAISLGTITDGSAKEWAVKSGVTVDGTEYSAKDWASSESLITGGSAKDWANEAAASASAAESIAGAVGWSAGTTYNTNDAAIGSDGNTYRSLVDNNTGKDPVTDDGTNWLQLTATTPDLVLKPEPVNPADTATGTLLTPTLEASDYYSLYGVPMAAAQWQISTVSDFATTEVDDEVAGTVTSYTPASNLSTLTTYYWRVRYKDDNGEYSAWSEATSFATADIYIDTPSITSPADNATDIPEQPVIESSVFAVVNGSDTHTASQWRVTRVSDGTVVHDSGDETSNLESYAIPAGVLDEGAVDYTVEVRHKGSTYGYSAWSPVVTFTTASAFFDQAIGDPVQGGYFSGYIVSDVDGQTYALITSDGSGDSVQTGAGTFQWRTSRTALSQAQTLSDGRSVMDHILANETLSDFPAFEWIQNNLNSGSGLNGYTDWYLPARDELELVYRHFKPTTEDNNDGTRDTSGFGGDGATHGTNNSSDPNGSGYTLSDPAQTGITSFQGANSDALEDSNYWSSTEKDASLSWRQNFGGGGQSINFKEISSRVRAVRRIAL